MKCSENMLRLAILACILAAFTAAIPLDVVYRHKYPRSVFPSGKIVGGSPTTINKVPWQVALEDSGFLFCGGSIISENYVLTSAQCTNGISAENCTVRYGTDKLESGGKIVKVASIARNSNFNFNYMDYDDAVLALASPIELSDSAKPVALRMKKPIAVGESGSVSGWGELKAGDGDLPTQLQSVGNVTVIDTMDCERTYFFRVSDRMVCAAGETGKDFCWGDTGGAFIIDGVQVGINSWGSGCGSTGYPGVFTDVGHPAIRAHINENSNNEATWV